MSEESKRTAALKYIANDFKVYPLAANTKIPIKGTHGYKSSTIEPKSVDEFWPFINEIGEGMQQNNVGLDLMANNVLVIDMDENHSNGISGIESYKELASNGKRLPPDTYIERTPQGGLHWFFSYPKGTPVKNLQGAFIPNSGIDIITTGVPIYPTEIDGQQYTPLDVCTLDEIKPVPNWVLEVFNVQQHPKNDTRKGITWTGKLLNELTEYVERGQRNVYLTRMCGKLFSTGATSEAVYEMLQFANDHLQPPLGDKEVNTIFKSILKREVKK